MPQVRHGDDGYPVFERADFSWFLERVRSLVPDHPEDVGVGRRKAGLDLELLIEVCNPRSRAVFTSETCMVLAAEAAERTGVLKPAVYVYGDPHPEAQESLAYAMRQV
jgi:hypothetical protein